MSQAMIQKMIEWIEHPMEFNCKPDNIEIVDERKLLWLNNQQEDCCLVKFSFKDDPQIYIGFTGPITWCFIGIDFTNCSFEELYLKYTGWYIAFTTKDIIPNEELQASLQESEKKYLKKWSTYYAKPTIIDKVFIGDEYQYHLQGFFKNTVLKTASETPTNIYGNAKRNVVDIKNISLGFYDYLGKMWNPFLLV